MIKVQNIYYMLAYAFTVLQEDSYKNIAAEKFEHTAELFAAILAKGIANQIKRGLGKEYISKIDMLSSPTGKIDVSNSIKRQTLLKKQLVCEFDEYTENAYINQILKTTAMLLLHSQEVSTPQKKALKKVLFYFINVDAVNPYRIEWSKIKYHRNNATYKLLINICYLVTCGMLLSEQEGSKKLSKFVDDKQMHSLYERFIRHYYRKHYPAYSVSAAQIAWNVDDGIIDFLPEMDSDVTIQHGSKALIIDAKYYNKTMHINNRFGNKTLHSGNLYQIFTYVKNKDTTNSGNVSGVLLYAKTDEEITPDCEYLMSGNRIGVKTLDLGADFANIMEQLDLLVEKYF